MKNCSRLVTADQGGQKNLNGKTTTVLFRHLFYCSDTIILTYIASMKFCLGMEVLAWYIDLDDIEI